MGKFINLEGRTFGMLTVLKRAENRNNRVFWTCKCECGNVKDIRASSLLSEATRSCGCMQAYTYRPNNNEGKNCNRKSLNEYDLSKEYGIGYTTNNEIFYFDLEDYDIINKYTWRINSHGYVIAQMRDEANNSQRTISMHRLVMRVDNSNIYVDHIHHNRNDNRKSQLRLVSPLQNAQNHKPYSKHQGVYWHKNKNKWEALIGFNGENIYLGMYDSYEDALNARLEAEDYYFKEYKYTPNSEQQSQEIFKNDLTKSLECDII